MISQLLQEFGLPVGLLVWFIYQNYKISKEYNHYIKNIANQTTAAINKSTDVDTKMLRVADRLERRLDNERST